MASKKGQYQLGIEISGKTNRSLKGAVDSAQGDVERLRRKMYASGRDMERAFSKIDTRGLKALDRAADLTFSGMVKSAKAAAAAADMVTGMTIMSMDIIMQMRCSAAGGWRMWMPAAGRS